MKRVKVNAIVDMTALGMLLLSVFTGIIPWTVLPSGGGGPRSGQEAAHALFLGLQRDMWRDLHTYASFAFVGLMIIHLLLHWRWIRCIPRFFAGNTSTACESTVGCLPDDAEG
jgi:hypothetical protein